jgi:hypothetical protein
MDITITISGLGGRTEVTVPEGTTVADLRATGQVSEGVGVRQAGQEISDSTTLVNGGHYVTTPPAAKHG